MCIMNSDQKKEMILNEIGKEHEFNIKSKTKWIWK